MNRHGMVTRRKGKETPNQEGNPEEMEEVEEVEMEETTGELSEENPQEDQTENPSPLEPEPEPEIEAEVRVNNQPVKPTEETKLDRMLNFMMEQFGQMNKERRQDK